MARIEDLGTPDCRPAAAVNPRFYLTDVGDEGISIPYSLAVTWDRILPPYEFDYVSYTKDGVTVHSGWVLGPTSELTEMDAEGVSHWIISNIVVHFKLPPVCEITILTHPDPEAGGSTSPKKKVITVFRGKRWGTTISASPAIGYRFTGWSKSSSSAPNPAQRATCSISGTAYGDATYEYTASFSQRSPSQPPAPNAPYDPNGPDPTDPTEGPKYSYIVVYTNCDPDGVATTTPDGITYVGYPGASKLVTCRATKNSPAGDDYEFDKWTGTEPISTQSGSSMRTMLTFPATAGETLVATFTAKYRTIGKHKVTTTPDPLDGGATSGDGEYAPGDTCVVVADAAEGCKFLKWKIGGNVVSRNAMYSFPVWGDVDLVALFHRWTMLIVRSASSGDILHGSGGSILHDGDP